ncbi:hypothetical protein [Streptococcus dentiloxodontae]
MKKSLALGLLLLSLVIVVGCSKQSKSDSNPPGSSTSTSKTSSSSTSSSSDKEITSGKTYEAALATVKSAFSSYEAFKTFYSDDVLSKLSEKGGIDEGSRLYYDYHKTIDDQKYIWKQSEPDVTLTYVEGSFSLSKWDNSPPSHTSGDIVPQYSVYFKVNEDGTTTGGTRHDVVKGYYYEDGATDYEKLIITSITSEEAAKSKDNY